MIQTYGTDAALLLEDATSKKDLGEDFGATLTAAEVEWLMDHEFAQPPKMFCGGGRNWVCEWVPRKPIGSSNLWLNGVKNALTHI